MRNFSEKAKVHLILETCDGYFEVKNRFPHVSSLLFCEDIRA